LDKVAEFLKEANECMAMARRATDGHRRDQLLLLAQKWTQLAAAREKMVRDTQKQQ
jgi:hypothetical protein